MRRITTWLLSTICALVLLFSYHTSTSPGTAGSVVADPGSGSGSGTASEPDASTGSGESNDSGASSGAATYTGDAVSTRFGDVQVVITVEGGRITASEVTRVPWGNPRDQEINSRAVPILNAEAVDAQSADIDMVSGATYTSQGYIGSLQSAIDEAGL
ncbi:FMN-binding protein [Fodinibacter luteus]|uniref:FMN-binding protein n=1 Tax=Fodinibacter luteus TaxID=552064 RepID=A0ABP8K7S5_9MICO